MPLNVSAKEEIEGKLMTALRVYIKKEIDHAMVQSEAAYRDMGRDSFDSANFPRFERKAESFNSSPTRLHNRKQRIEESPS